MDLTGRLSNSSTRATIAHLHHALGTDVPSQPLRIGRRGTLPLQRKAEAITASAKRCEGDELIEKHVLDRRIPGAAVRTYTVTVDPADSSGQHTAASAGFSVS
jgi:hypothetical protein